MGSAGVLRLYGFRTDPQAARSLEFCSIRLAYAILWIGDTPYDIEAALRGGVQIITVCCGGFWSESLSTFNDPGDILAHYEILSDALHG
jgi:hypothetical protein